MHWVNSANGLYTLLLDNELPFGPTPKAMLDALRSLAIDAPQRAIEKAIATAKAAGDDAETQLEAGRTLMSSTQKPLQQLQQLLGASDMRYSRTADKLANAILQCSINYFNEIDGENRTIIGNTLRLAEYASHIAVGKMAKDHIKHNLDILKEKESNLPPAGVEQEMAAIMNALKLFVNQPDKIEHSVTLLITTKPHLQSMKQKLGTSNAFYLKVSTQVVNNAMHNLIEEVNFAQKFISTTDRMMAAYSLMLNVSPVVDKAWKAICIMDGFDMEADFRQNRYLPNRTSLKDLKDTLDRASNSISSSSRYSTSSGSSSIGGCYIATMVYGSYEHPQVMVLRGFRDDVLQQHAWGRAFVRFYYRNSPTWVEHLKNNKPVNHIIRVILDGFIKLYKHEK